MAIVETRLPKTQLTDYRFTHLKGLLSPTNQGWVRKLQGASHGGNMGHFLSRFLELEPCPEPHPACVIPTVTLGTKPEWRWG